MLLMSLHNNFPRETRKIQHSSTEKKKKKKKKKKNLIKHDKLIRFPLRKHAYSNKLKSLQPKRGKFSDKNSDIFHISAQNIDCGYSFLSRNKKNNVYPCKPQFYYIKVGLKGVKII